MLHSMLHVFIATPSFTFFAKAMAPSHRQQRLTVSPDRYKKKKENLSGRASIAVSVGEGEGKGKSNSGRSSVYSHSLLSSLLALFRLQNEETSE